MDIDKIASLIINFSHLKLEEISQFIDLKRYETQDKKDN